MKLGDKVMSSGYPGTVTEVCTGQLSGMVVVRLDSGSICCGISEFTSGYTGSYILDSK